MSVRRSKKMPCLSEFDDSELSLLKTLWQKHCDSSPQKRRWISVTPPRQQNDGVKHSVQTLALIDEQWVLRGKTRDKKIICIHEMCDFVLSRVTQGGDRDTHEKAVIEESNIRREDIRKIFEISKEIKLRSFQFADTRIHPIPWGSTAASQDDAVLARDHHPLRQHQHVWAKLPEFIQRIEGLPQTDTKVSQCFDHIKNVLEFGRLPRIYVDPSLSHIPGDALIKDADVLYFDPAGADRFLRNRPNLDGKVLIIRDDQPVESSFQSFVSYYSQWPDIDVEVQHLTKWEKEDHFTDHYKFKDIVADLQDPRPRITSLDQPPFNILNLASRTYRPRPLCLSQERFTLIDQLFFEARSYATKSSGKTVASKTGNRCPSDLEDCLSFEIAGQAWSASLWHKDSSGVGTWVRCESGLKLWPTVISPSKQQITDFSAEGELWKPTDVPVISLFPGDTLIMVPENYNIHAPIVMEDCHMTGGMFWDSENIRFILNRIQRQRASPHTSNEPLSKQLRFVLQALFFRARRSADDGLLELCSQLLDTLPRCNCRAQCIGKTCPCKQSRLDCTVACHVERTCRNGAYETR